MTFKINKISYLSLVLFSGGQDSIFLAWLFLLVNNRNRILMSHTNHFSQLDSFLCLYHCFLIFHQIQFPGVINFFPVVKNYKNQLTENFFRENRYRQNFRVSEFYHCLDLLTAHTKSDKIETILANFIRGTTFFSLVSLFSNKTFFTFYYHQCLYIKDFDILNSKIEPEQFIFFADKTKQLVQTYSLKIKPKFHLRSKFITVKNLKRPLLDSSRLSVKKICNSTKIPLFYDRSNKLLLARRNRIRYHLLRYISIFLNPNFEEQIILLVESAKDPLELFKELLYFKKKLQKVVVPWQAKMKYSYELKKNSLLLDRQLFALFPSSLNYLSVLNLPDNFMKKKILEQLLENPSFSSYILMDETTICYLSAEFVQIEQFIWVTWDSNPELIG
jgi:tRNA(Ile)-lysidine synthase TilS/MesJ